MSGLSSHLRAGSATPVPLGEHLGDLAAAVADGEVDHEVRDRALAHAAVCPGCRAALADQRAVRTLIGGLPTPRPTEALLTRLASLPGLVPAPPAAPPALQSRDPASRSRDPELAGLLVGDGLPDVPLAPGPRLPVGDETWSTAGLGADVRGRPYELVPSGGVRAAAATGRGSSQRHTATPLRPPSPRRRVLSRHLGTAAVGALSVGAVVLSASSAVRAQGPGQGDAGPLRVRSAASAVVQMQPWSPAVIGPRSATELVAVLRPAGLPATGVELTGPLVWQGASVWPGRYGVRVPVTPASLLPFR